MNFNQILLQTYESDIEELELERADLTYYPGFDGEIVEKYVTCKRPKREYLAYLEKIQKEIRDEITDQEKIIRQNNPSIDDCISRINGRKMTLWERSPRHDDFLEVMVGMGDIPAEIELSYQQKSAIEKSTESADAMYKLVEAKRTLTNVPVKLLMLL